MFVTRLRRGQVLKARPVYSTHVKACAGLTKKKKKKPVAKRSLISSRSFGKPITAEVWVET